jgi:uncharacterized HAD superfamily protein
MVAKSKIIKIGFDLDGVVARHAMGGFWVWARKFKEKVFKKAKLRNYYYPGRIERYGWTWINKRRKPFVDEGGLLKAMSSDENKKLYLVTSRLKFLEEMTIEWLKEYSLLSCFEEILTNVDDVDPFVFKARAIKTLSLDIFIDDDLEIINFLKKKTRSKLFWVVPRYRNRKENRDRKVIPCGSLAEALRIIADSKA